MISTILGTFFGSKARGELYWAEKSGLNKKNITLNKKNITINNRDELYNPIILHSLTSISNVI